MNYPRFAPPASIPSPAKSTPRPARRSDLPLGALACLLVPLALAGCRDGQVTAYRIPKEVDGPPASAASPAALPAAGDATTAGGMKFAATGGAPLEWTAPAGWKPKTGSSMRKGSYLVGDEAGANADLAITAFPGNVGGDLANVNRWRGQVQLSPLAESELATALVPLEANGLKFAYVELAGGTAEKPERMLGAIVPFDGATWFFKLTGPDAVVAAAKPAYLEFLRSVKPAAVPAATAPSAAPVSFNVPAPAPAAPSPAAPDMAGSPVTKASGPDLRWSAPPHWTSVAASAMRKATYQVKGADGATAELAVTAFPGSVGGDLANVNRWRGQLQLPPIAEADLAAATSHLTVGPLAITVVDLTGGTSAQPVRLLGAIVPYNGANWFFKFTGPAPLVAREQAAYLALLQTLQVP